VFPVIDAFFSLMDQLILLTRYHTCTAVMTKYVCCFVWISEKSRASTIFFL